METRFKERTKENPAGKNPSSAVRVLNGGRG